MFTFVKNVALSIGLSLILVCGSPCYANPVNIEATAYTLAEDECGKAPTDVGYGITASGEYVEEGFIATDINFIPMHSLCILYGLGDLDGVYEAKDTGGAIIYNKVDIYVEEKSTALNFGRRQGKALILRYGRKQLFNFDEKITLIDTFKPYSIWHDLGEDFWAVKSGENIEYYVLSKNFLKKFKIPIDKL